VTPKEFFNKMWADLHREGNPGADAAVLNMRAPTSGTKIVEWKVCGRRAVGYNYADGSWTFFLESSLNLPTEHMHGASRVYRQGRWENPYDYEWIYLRGEPYPADMVEFEMIL
jgi:hypothetical protein